MVIFSRSTWTNGTPLKNVMSLLACKKKGNTKFKFVYWVTKIITTYGIICIWKLPLGFHFWEANHGGSGKKTMSCCWFTLINTLVNQFGVLDYDLGVNVAILSLFELSTRVIVSSSSLIDVWNIITNFRRHIYYVNELNVEIVSYIIIF